MLVQLATSSDFPALTEDDRLAADALAARGVRVEPVIWSSPDAGPGDTPDAVVIRSCWDYHLREAEFRLWIAHLEQRGVVVINPPALVRWNLHKSYISDLADRGIAVVPTICVEAGDARGLREIIAGAGWDQAVVKPAISLSAYETWRVAALDADAHADRFARLRAHGAVLVQRFLHEVMDDGEWSLVFFGMQFSHAVRKRPKPGDFRVQTEHGGSAVSDVPPADLMAAGGHVLRSLPVAPIYCRVDGVVVGGVFTLMEVECIDPFLFLADCPRAAGLFAAEVIEYVGTNPGAGA